MVLQDDTVIDWTRIQDLRSEIGPDDFDEIVALFLDEADEVVQRLPTLTEASSMERDLHFLKGSALNLGFFDLAQACQTGEQLAASGLCTFEMGVVVAIYHQSRTAFLNGLNSLAA